MDEPRYFVAPSESRIKHVKAGVLSSELCTALGISTGQPPPYYREMLVEGYPPGFVGLEGAPVSGQGEQGEEDYSPEATLKFICGGDEMDFSDDEEEPAAAARRAAGAASSKPRKAVMTVAFPGIFGNPPPPGADVRLWSFSSNGRRPLTASDFQSSHRHGNEISRAVQSPPAIYHPSSSSSSSAPGYQQSGHHLRLPPLPSAPAHGLWRSGTETAALSGCSPHSSGARHDAAPRCDVYSQVYPDRYAGVYPAPAHNAHLHMPGLHESQPDPRSQPQPAAPAGASKEPCCLPHHSPDWCFKNPPKRRQIFDKSKRALLKSLATEPY